MTNHPILVYLSFTQTHVQKHIHPFQGMHFQKTQAAEDLEQCSAKKQSFHTTSWYWLLPGSCIGESLRHRLPDSREVHQRICRSRAQPHPCGGVHMLQKHKEHRLKDLANGQRILRTCVIQCYGNPNTMDRYVYIYINAYTYIYMRHLSLMTYESPFSA